MWMSFNKKKVIFLVLKEILVLNNFEKIIMDFFDMWYELVM